MFSSGLNAISIHNLSFSYKLGASHNVVPVFDGLDFSIDTGQILGIIGRNGSGKSSLLNLLRGIIVPDTGSIHIYSNCVSENGKLHQKPSATLISQKPDVSLGPTMSIFENYIFAKCGSTPSFRWAYSKMERNKCRDIVARAGAGLEDKLDEQIRFLSGGQQQALSVILGLMSANPILLMDEPTASLDPLSSERILNLAAEDGRNKQGVVAIVSHRLEELMPRCDSMLILSDKKCTLLHRDHEEWSIEAFRRAL